jgi:hypothetical protein
MAKAAIFRSTTGRKAEAGLLSNAMLVLLIASIACLASCVTIKPMPNAPTTSTEPFPRPGDFTEGYTPQSGPILNGLQSTYSGTLAVTMMDRSAVARVLPPGFHLAQPRNNSTTRHPVIHLIGDQLEPSTLIGGYPVNVGTGYREMVLLVPYVVRDSGSGLYNFAARMFLTDPTAVIGGNEIFGYAKVLAQLNRAEASPRTELSGCNAGRQHELVLRSDRPDEPMGPSLHATAAMAGLARNFPDSHSGRAPSR